ncbi:MAG TPA: PQQ-like beta-propeller repeat protein [Pirellulaceae bacterium]|nr:PQQ-like beta-propeller repeat protein [Pirellulaceae bacterium]
MPPDLGTRHLGEDWPQFLGPTADSRSSEKGILVNWPKEGPKIVWQKPAGEGYGIGTISRGRLFQFDRYGDIARLTCMKSETGEELWKFEYPTNYQDLYSYNGGPRASPLIDDDRVYTYGVEGMLHCIRAVDGEVLWKVDANEKFGVIQNFFGVGSTPVIEGDLLIVMVGGSPAEDKSVPPGQLDRVSPNGTAIVAFDKFTGEVKYQIGDDLASYASLKLATIDGRRWCFAFCRSGLLAFDPATGKIDFNYPWRSKMLESVNASTPVVVGDEVFISETYAIGSSLLKVAPGKQTVVWRDETTRREKSFKAHWNTPVMVDGFLYGCSGRNPPDAEQRCIEWKTGKVQWTVPNQIRTSMLYVDGHLISLGEFGSLQLLKVNPEKYEVLADVTLRRQVAGPLPPGLEAPPLLKYPCWAAPVLSHRLLYLRGDDRLVCLELNGEKSE